MLQFCCRKAAYSIFGLLLDLICNTFSGVWVDFNSVLKIRIGSGLRNMTVRSTLLLGADVHRFEPAMGKRSRGSVAYRVVYGNAFSNIRENVFGACVLHSRNWACFSATVFSSVFL